MPFTDLSRLQQEAPLRIQLVCCGVPTSLSLAGLIDPLRLAAGILGPQRLQLASCSLADALQPTTPPAHICLLIADEDSAAITPEHCKRLAGLWHGADLWGGVGAAVLWLARAGTLDGVRVALPWSLYAQADDAAERAILTPQLYELDGRRLTCCGGAASIDFTLTLIEAIFGATLQAGIKETLCVDVVRGPAERQRVALQARFGVLQPKLSEAVSLMEANIEEPLATDDIASLVGISRRQLERQFKQYLGSVPSRYYLELRLQRSRKLLLESNDSIVQIGLMCGFSSGSHFSTAYGALFGITPREERQRKLRTS